MTYDEPIYATYTLAAADLTSAAELATFSGPYGKQGRVVSISALVTTGVTVAASEVSVNTLDDAVVAGTLSVPVSSADAVANNSTNGADATLIPADSAFTIDTDGGATAGAANITVVIAWF